MGAKPAIDKFGQFKAELTDIELFAVIAEVARAELPDHPDRLAQRPFDDCIAAHRHRYPGVPSARAICMRLNEGRQQHIGWRSIVRAALAGDAQVRQTVAAAGANPTHRSPIARSGSRCGSWHASRKSRLRLTPTTKRERDSQPLTGFAAAY